MDRMSDRHHEHLERLDQVVRRVSEAEDEESTLGATQKKVYNFLLTLQAKAERLEARSHINNVHIVDVADLTQMDNMEKYVEQLTISLLGRKTFSDLYVVERAHRSLAPCPIIVRLLNYRDRDTALRKARALGELFPD
ncbi:hypothetical protein NDU88_000654 [Pleurodeles waltl]|uniref:Uncharacterized protein n=1 Tax=Pleurodeles waltl TaxID=8319 RepID=A0AAV7VU57_PLEWA|nr:hypothetical protein NDU88_000654 [Pleurodeles waltl]